MYYFSQSVKIFSYLFITVFIFFIIVLLSSPRLKKDFAYFPSHTSRIRRKMANIFLKGILTRKDSYTVTDATTEQLLKDVKVVNSMRCRYQLSFMLYARMGGSRISV